MRTPRPEKKLPLTMSAHTVLRLVPDAHGGLAGAKRDVGHQLGEHAAFRTQLLEDAERHRGVVEAGLRRRSGCLVVCRNTSRSGASTGRNRRTTAFMTLNTAALAPIPSAKVRMVTAANTGVRLSCRIAKRKSCSMLLGRSSTAGGCHAVPAQSSLVRSIGTFGLAASIVNVTIGGGIFRLPADMAATLGPTAPIAYLLCAVAMGLIVLCMAEAGSRVSLTGGLYAYVEVAFGPFVGFLAGFLLWMVLTFVMAAVATVLIGEPRRAGAGAVVTRGVGGGARRHLRVLRDGQHPRRRARRARQHGTHGREDPAAAAADRRRAVRDRFRPTWRSTIRPTSATLARSSILLIFAFAGIEAALVPGGEVKDPARTVPRAIFIAMATITLLYAGLQFVAQGVLGRRSPTSKAAPLADAAGVALGGWARHLLLVGAVVSMLGHAGAMILATPRTLFAFARDGFLPAALARLHPVHRSPVDRDPRAVRDRARARDHQHVRAAGDSRQPLHARALRDVLRRDLAAPPPRRARRRHAVQGSGARTGDRAGVPGDRLDADERHARRVGRVRHRARRRDGDLRVSPKGPGDDERIACDDAADDLPEMLWPHGVRFHTRSGGWRREPAGEMGRRLSRRRVSGPETA